MSSNFWLTEEQFSKINPLLPNKPRGVPRVDDRRVLSGILFCLQRGYRWSDVPAEYGPARTRWRLVADQMRPRLPKLATLMDTAEENVLAKPRAASVAKPAKNRPRNGVQTDDVGARKMAETERRKPNASDHSGHCIHRRDQTNSNCRLIKPSPTFGPSSDEGVFACDLDD